MADEPMTEEEARRRFVAELLASSAQGPAPDCAERLASINAEFDAACARRREADRRKKQFRER